LSSTVLCVNELGPISPHTFAPAPGWSRDGHRIKAPLEYSRGGDKVWVYGALRVRDGQELTLTAASRNTLGYLQLLNAVDQANPEGELYLITDNLSSHTSAPVRAWLDDQPRVQQVPIPKRPGWLNRQERWWRLFRRDALAAKPLPTLWTLNAPLVALPNSLIVVPTPAFGSVPLQSLLITDPLLFSLFEEPSTS
jgi:hypothetical protein